MGRIEGDQNGRAEIPVVLVFLGDYVDRGPNSKGVVDRLIRGFWLRSTPVFLKGNHEDLLLSFLKDPMAGQIWLRNGGDATLRSYRVEPGSVYRALWSEANGLADAARQFRALLPADHLHFYEALKPFHRAGDYFFAHAGVRPHVPLEKQSEDDLLWIRREFLTATGDFGAVVVHGHTPSREPQVLDNRIGTRYVRSS